MIQPKLEPKMRLSSESVSVSDRDVDKRTPRKGGAVEMPSLRDFESSIPKRNPHKEELKKWREQLASWNMGGSSPTAHGDSGIDFDAVTDSALGQIDEFYMKETLEGRRMTHSTFITRKSEYLSPIASAAGRLRHQSDEYETSPLSIASFDWDDPEWKIHREITQETPTVVMALANDELPKADPSLNTVPSYARGW